MQPLRWAILGLDLIAEEFAQHLQQHNGIAAAASTDVDFFPSRIHWVLMKCGTLY